MPRTNIWTIRNIRPGRSLGLILATACCLVAGIGLMLFYVNTSLPAGHIVRVTGIEASGKTCTVQLKWPSFTSSEVGNAYVVVTTGNSKSAVERIARATAVFQANSSHLFAGIRNVNIDNNQDGSSLIIDTSDKPPSVQVPLAAAGNSVQLYCAVYVVDDGGCVAVSNVFSNGPLDSPRKNTNNTVALSLE